MTKAEELKIRIEALEDLARWAESHGARDIGDWDDYSECSAKIMGEINDRLVRLRFDLKISLRNGQRPNQASDRAYSEGRL